MHRPERKRKDNGDEMAPKRRKKRRVNNTANIDIEQIANDSVSNPSHLQ